MNIPLYMDVHVHRGITSELRAPGVDVLTAQEDGADRLDHDSLLNRATEVGRVLFTNDRDFLRIAHKRMQSGSVFSGVLFAPQTSPIGQVINDLEVCARAGTSSDFAFGITFLPLLPAPRA